MLRERAVTLGDIARILVSKDEVDEALALHEERLASYRALNDVVGLGNALWSMSQIEVQREDYQAAFEHLSESYQLLMQAGRLDGVCIVGLDLGKLLCAAGQVKQGLEILPRSREGLRNLG